MASNQGGIEKKRWHVTLIELNASNQDMSMSVIIMPSSLLKGHRERGHRESKTIQEDHCQRVLQFR